jgi:DNA-binding NtrC family response regulator
LDKFPDYFSQSMDIRTQLIGESSATRAVLADIECAAASDAKVLITGESGVGKEVVAQLIHQRSRRSNAQLIAINCAGVPDSLLASELFGHVRGSFTDAYRDKQGWLERADHGTIFMDEVGEMSLQMQAALLRFLENGEIQRVGADRRSAVVDVRVVAATNRKLLDRVAAKEFREDLFYRLNVIHIEVPPLRERPEDVPPLVDHFLRMFVTTYRVARPDVHPEAMDQLTRAPWPGNVRQLRNVLERLVVNSRRDVITVADLPREVLSVSADARAQETAASPHLHRELFARMVQEGESFWTAVYEPFMVRDITRADVRAIVREGLMHTRGGYKALAALFNIPADHRRLLSFLRKHDCHLPEQELHCASATLDQTHKRRALAE